MKIKDSISKTWGKALLCFGLAFMLTGCFTKTVYVPDQTPVRLRENVEGVKVWVLDENGVIHESVMDLKEGWFIISLPQYPPVEKQNSGKLVRLK